MKIFEFFKILFHRINPFSVSTMEKILKNSSVNELIFMLEPADI
jgi:hypothetical protein